MIRRRIAALLVGIIGVTVIVLGLGAPSASAIDICKDAPAPISPRAGMAGLLTQRPAQVRPDANPFADPRIPIADVYGLSWSWAVYDLGCTTNALDDPVAVGNTQVANVVLGTGAAGVAVVAVVERLSMASTVDWLYRWVGSVTEAIRPMILGGPTANGPMIGLLGIAVIGCGVLLAWRAKRANYADTMKAAGIVTGCVALAVFTLVVPAKASEVADTGVKEVSKIAGSAFNASLSDGANRQALYRSWLAGSFGDPDSQAAKDLGPRLMWATHYTWAEWDQVQNDPKARAELDKKKSAEFKKVGEELKRVNPSGYEAFKGKGDRIGPAMFGVVAAFVLGLFALIAYAVILFARVIMQVLVIAAPVATVAGVLPPGYTVLMRLWDLFTGALVAVFKFVLAAGIVATAQGLLATLDPVSSLVWMAILTAVALVITKPFRTFKTLMPGLDPDRHYTREALGKLVGVATKVGGAVLTGGVSGAVAGAATSAATASAEAPPAPSAGKQAPQQVQLIQQSRPALPPPIWRRASVTGKLVGLEAATGTRLDQPQLTATASPGKKLSERRPGQSERPRGRRTGTGDIPLTPMGDKPQSPAVLKDTGTQPGAEPRRDTGTRSTGPAFRPDHHSQRGSVLRGEVLHGDVLDDRDSVMYRRGDGAVRRGATSSPVTAPVSGSTPTRDVGSDQPSNELVLYRSSRGGGRHA